MELHLDRLLADLRDNPASVLGAIDADPLLLKRESGPLVLANARQALYTPQEQHQLYAKGIVYRRDPYRLVSLPLIKIYNLGERSLMAADLVQLGREAGASVRFLRKIDGSLIQVFRAEGRVWFSTRGVLEGSRWRPDEEAGEEGANHFDFVAEARALAEASYPALLQESDLLENITLLFELIHPRARNVTDYGSRADLVFLGAFDRTRYRYLPYEEILTLASAYNLNPVDALCPKGETLPEQIESLLASLAGTDQEGSVVNFELPDRVIYRVKVKSPDYLRLMQLLTSCTYDRTVEMIEAHPHWIGWDDLRAHLQELGRDSVPEEVLAFYQTHHSCYREYLGDLERLRQWGERAFAELEAELGGRAGKEPAAFRKAFAGRAVRSPLSWLLFAALDGRLDVRRVRRTVRSPREAKEALELAGQAGL
jgi:hypothetical protein